MSVNNIIENKINYLNVDTDISIEIILNNKNNLSSMPNKVITILDDNNNIYSDKLVLIGHDGVFFERVSIISNIKN